MVEAEAKTVEVIEGWRDKGMTRLVVDDLTKMSDYIGKNRTWFYNTLPKLETRGLLRADDEGGKKFWHILPKAPDLAVVEDTEDDQDGAA